MIPKLTHDQVLSWFSTILTTDLCPFLVGRVGKGKSHLGKAYAKKKNLLPITIYLDSMYEMDITGYATPNQQTKRFEYLPCNLFPLAGDPIPINPDTKKPYAGFLVIFEEFGNCPKSMQVAAQRIILDKHVGAYPLHEKAQIILLGNTVSSGANAIPISAAIRTRVGIAEIDTTSRNSVNNFIAYMKSSGFHQIVIDWVTENPDVVTDAYDDLTNDGESPFTTNRGLEAASTIINEAQKYAASSQQPLAVILRDKLVAFQSILGYARGAELHSEIMNPPMGFEEILTSPTTAQTPTSTAQLAKMSSYLAATVASDSQLNSVFVYLDRLNAEQRMSIISKVNSASNFFANSQKMKSYMQSQMNF